jgi:hypothetical protein
VFNFPASPPQEPYDWTRLRKRVADYGGIIGLALLAVDWLAWAIGLMHIYLALILAGAFGMLAALGFIGWFRTSREEPFNSIGRWIGEITPDHWLTIGESKAIDDLPGIPLKIQVKQQGLSKRTFWKQ